VQTSTTLNVTQGQTGAITLLNDGTIRAVNPQTLRAIDLPTGITLEGSGRNWLFRTSSAVSPGSYKIVTALRGSNAPESVTEFTLNVLKPAEIYALTPGNVKTIRVHAGVPVTVGLDLVGLPKSVLPAVGSTVIQLQGRAALPSAITYRGLNSFGVPTGTGRLGFGFAANATPGKYLLGFKAVSCQAGEACTDTVANDSAASFLFNVVLVAPGDATADGQVNCNDVALVRSALGKNVSQTGYNVNADVNLDGVVDIRDLSFVSSKQRAGTTCP
jgi:hypothetical protein